MGFLWHGFLYPPGMLSSQGDTTPLPPDPPPSPLPPLKKKKKKKEKQKKLIS